MPLYEYECSDCKSRFEFLQKINESDKKECPICHCDTLKKLISPAGFQLKGTGWYVTDFKNKTPNKKEKSNEIKSETKSETKNEIKSENKSNTKTEAKSENQKTEK